MDEDAEGERLPFHSALLSGDLASAQCLFESGTRRQDLLAKTTPDRGWRAIHFACRSGSNEAVSWLLGLDACDPSARTAKGETALHLSAMRGDERVCKTLINGGCPVEAVTLEGKTALHLAAEMGHLPVTRFLVVCAGLSPATPDGGGASAVDLALDGNHKSVVRLLQKNCPGVPMGIPIGIPKRTNGRRSSGCVRSVGDGGDAASNTLAAGHLSRPPADDSSIGVPPGQGLTSAASVSLTEWLGNLGLGAYESRLVSKGFDTLEAMSTATDSDLEAIGLKEDH
eukprot:g1303.t1